MSRPLLLLPPAALRARACRRRRRAPGQLASAPADPCQRLAADMAAPLPHHTARTTLSACDCSLPGLTLTTAQSGLKPRPPGIPESDVSHALASRFPGNARLHSLNHMKNISRARDRDIHP